MENMCDDGTNQRASSARLHSVTDLGDGGGKDDALQSGAILENVVPEGLYTVMKNDLL